TSADAGVHTFTGVTLVTVANPAYVHFRDTAYVTGGSSGAGTAVVAITPAEASTFSVTGFPGTSTAGNAGNVTVTAKDPYGNVCTWYNGTVHFASSDPQAVLPDDYTFTATDSG